MMKGAGYPPARPSTPFASPRPIRPARAGNVFLAGTGTLFGQEASGWLQRPACAQHASGL